MRAGARAHTHTHNVTGSEGGRKFKLDGGGGGAFVVVLFAEVSF